MSISSLFGSALVCGSLLAGLTVTTGCTDADWADFAAGLSEGLQPETQPRINEATFVATVDGARTQIAAKGYEIVHTERQIIRQAGDRYVVQVPPLDPGFLHDIVVLSDGATLQLDVWDQNGAGPYLLNEPDSTFPHTKSVLVTPQGAPLALTATVSLEPAAFADNLGARHIWVYVAKKVR